MQIFIEKHSFLRDGLYDVVKITPCGCVAVKECHQEFEVYIEDECVTKIIFFPSTDPIVYTIKQ